VSGVEDEIFAELKQTISTIPQLTFRAFNKTSLKRVIEDVDAEP
jgi:hypothetical protein